MDTATSDATELLDALGRRDLSSRELVEELLERIDRVDPSVNAVVALDAERARDAADRADEARAGGRDLGPLHGLPMTVKDVWETEGLVTTAGAPELADHVPAADAVAVARLKGAGAIVLGKTNTPLYAGDIQTYNDVYGRTANPWDVDRTAGGSSGGAAVALATGMTPLELGSDIGGSIRTPAHCNGVYGLKPSWGLVPLRGHIPGPPGSLADTDVGVSGPLARSVRDLALAFELLAGPLPEVAAAWRLELDAGPPVPDVAGLRVAVTFDEGGAVGPLAAEERALLGAFADRLADAGARVEAVPLPVPLDEGMRDWQELVLPIIGAGLPAEVFEAMQAFDGAPADDAMANSARSLVLRHRDWLRADERRQHHRAAWARAFDDHDVVLAPVLPTAAFPHDTERSMAERTLEVDGATLAYPLLMAWCGAVGAVLLPVVALPAGRTGAGLPVGVQVIGPHLGDRRLLRLVEAIDAAAGPGFTPPPLGESGK